MTDGSRASQPSGLDLLPDLPLRDFVLGGPDDRSATGRRGGCPGLLATLAGGVSSPPAAPRPGPPAGRRAQQAAFPPCSEPVGALVLFQRPMTTVLRQPWGDEEELLARWADERCGRGDLSRPAGPGWGNGWPFGPTCWWAVCGGDPGDGCLPASVVFTPAFWHPCRVHSAWGGGDRGWSLRSTPGYPLGPLPGSVVPGSGGVRAGPAGLELACADGFNLPPTRPFCVRGGR